MKDYLEQAAQTAPKVTQGEVLPVGALFCFLNGVVYQGTCLDQVKKSLFYGKPYTLGDSRAHDTAKGVESAIGAGSDLANVEILHGVIGAITETVELGEALLTSLQTGTPIDLVNLSEECGDVMWYLACILRATGTTFEAVMEQNIAKLRKRYPKGFSEYDAMNRDLAAERAILEQSPK